MYQELAIPQRWAIERVRPAEPAPFRLENREYRLEGRPLSFRGTSMAIGYHGGRHPVAVFDESGQREPGPVGLEFDFAVLGRRISERRESVECLRLLPSGTFERTGYKQEFVKRLST